MITTQDTTDKIIASIFDSDIDIDKDEEVIKERYNYMIKAMLIRPYIKAVQLISLVVKEFSISERHAWRDYEKIKPALFNMKDAGKEFYRYFANEMIKEGAQKIIEAKDSFELKRAEALLKIADSLTKVNNLDKEEIEKLRWDELQSFLPEPTTDVTVLGKRPIGDLERKKNEIRRKYLPEMSETRPENEN